MKLDEVISDKQQLDEVPAGGLGQMAKKLGSRVLNKVPGATAKSKAGNLAGQADLGDTANNLHKEFNKYLGTQGKKMAQATGEDLSAFLKMKKHTTKATVPSGVLQKQQLNDILMTVSKEALAGQGGTASDTQKKSADSQQSDANNDGKDDKTGEPVAPDDKTSAGGGDKIEFAPEQPVLFVSKSGKTTSAKVVGKSMDGDDSKVAVQGSRGQKYNIPRDKLLDPKTKKPFKPGAKSSAIGTEIPPELQKQIDALNTQQKKELASLL